MKLSPVSDRFSLSRPLVAAAMVAAVSIVGFVGCSDVSGSSTSVLSIRFDTLPAPSVVVGDTLRDSTGAVVRPKVHAFNFKGDEIPQPPVYFLSPDSGVTVDSATGIVVADSLRSTAARIVATVGTLQAVQLVTVTLSPDLLQAVNARDSLQYSLVDTTKNLSPQLQVKLTHGVAPDDSAVKSWIVSFAIVSQANPQLGELIDDAGKPSLVDTTDASGVAGRRIRLHPLFLTSTTDSIVVNATAKYRGAQVNGSPVQLVLLLKPPG
jgi:hypothetical protein